MAATLRTSSLTKQTSTTTTMQAAIPASAEDGDIVVAIHSIDAGINEGVIVGPPAGWTRLAGSPTHADGASDSDFYTDYLWKVVDGDAGQNYTFTRTQPTGQNHMVVGMFVVQGADTVNPIPAFTLHHNEGGTSESDPLPFDDITVSRPGSLLIASKFGNGNLNDNSVTGFTDRYETRTSPFNNLSVYGATKEQADSGTISGLAVNIAGPNTGNFTWGLIAVQAAPEPTSKERIQSGSGTIAYCLEIEGYDKIIANWDDTSAIATAYAGTDWSTVIGGLQVTGEYTQEIRPMDPEIDSGTMTFLVTPDGDDTLAKAVFAAHKSTGNRANLTSTADNDDVTINVDDTTDLPSATDFAYIGTERVQYTGSGSTTLTGCTRGYNSPFAVDGGTRFGRWHAIGETAGEATYRPPVTDWKRVWIGSHVALRAFRVVNGAVDSRGAAHLLFAGTVSDIQDTEQGNTKIVATDIRKAVADTVLLSDQYSAQPLEGAVITSIDRVVLFGTGQTTGGTNNEDTPEEITFTGGRMTAQDVIDEINDAIDASGTLVHSWRCTKVSGDYVKFFMEGASGTYWTLRASVKMTYRVAQLLGFDVKQRSDRDGDLYEFEAAQGSLTDPIIVVTSQFPSAFAVPTLNSSGTLNVTANTGTFVNQGDQVPQPLKNKYNTGTGTWGFLRYRDFTFLAKKTNDTTFTVYWDDDVYRLFSQEPGSMSLTTGETVHEGEAIPRFTQVLFFEDNFYDVIPRVFASTGVSGYNHATYDAYDRQLGCAIPWELLGDSFLETVRDVSEVADTTLSIVLEKPTKLVEILIPELALRNAHLVFNEGLRFTRPKLAFSTADHTLSDSTMVDSPDRASDARPEMQWSRDMITNVLKVEYNRSLDDEYHDVIEVRNQTSISEHGIHNPVTIKARNTMLRGKTSDANAIYDLVSHLAGDLLAIYDEPLQVVTVSCSGDVLVGMAPGDSVSLSNSFVRYHGDGTRGVTNVAAYVLRTSFDLATLRGEVTLVLTGADLARAAIYSPAAKIDETASSGGFTAGYDSAGPTIKLKANEFTNSADDDDITHFAVSEAIRVIEKSPSTPGSPQSWTVTIDAKDEANQELDLSAALTGFDTSKEYYVISDDYSAAVTSQKTDTYIADDADDKISNTERSRTYRDNDQGIVLKDPIGSADVRHEYPPTDGTWWDEAKPMHPAMMQALMRSTASLINHGTVQQCPLYLLSEIATSGTTEALELTVFLPVLSGFSRSRSLTIGPRVDSTAGDTITVVVYSSATKPTAADGATGYGDFDFAGPSRSVTFTATGATSITDVAAQSLPLVPSKSGLGTWITITAKESGGTCNLYGFHTWHVDSLL